MAAARMHVALNRGAAVKTQKSPLRCGRNRFRGVTITHGVEGFCRSKREGQATKGRLLAGAILHSGSTGSKDQTLGYV